MKRAITSETRPQFRHHNKIDDHQDAKDDETHEVIAADDKFPKGRDDLTGRVRALMAIHQYDRVEATLSPRRSMVAKSRVAGKAENSRGL